MGYRNQYMIMATKHDVLKEELAGYLRAKRKEKEAILDRLETTVKMHRKAIVRRFKVLQTRKEDYDWFDHRGRDVYYTPDCIEALHDVWTISHELCAERLHPILHEYVDILIRDNMWHHSDEATGKLQAMSVGTMKKHTQSFDRIVSGGGRNMTKPSSLKEVIPVRRGPWENPEPGRGEIDTVAHCGNDGSGEYGFTLQYTDVSLLWCFLEAQMGKGKKDTVDSMQRIYERSPFPLEWIDPDSGSEFINWYMNGWCKERKIIMTRIRPGMKNDHGRIEQKNDKNVRKCAGYIRIDTKERLAVLKEMYKILEIYINHFLPSMMCIKKIRYNISHSSRKYDLAKTPYQRFMEHKKISRESKEQMRRFHQTLNPKVLHDELLKLRKLLFKGAKFTKNRYT